MERNKTGQTVASSVVLALVMASAFLPKHESFSSSAPTEAFNDTPLFVSQKPLLLGNDFICELPTFKTETYLPSSIKKCLVTDEMSGLEIIDDDFLGSALLEEEVAIDPNYLVQRAKLAIQEGPMATIKLIDDILFADVPCIREAIVSLLDYSLTNSTDYGLNAKGIILLNAYRNEAFAHRYHSISFSNPLLQKRLAKVLSRM